MLRKTISVILTATLLSGCASAANRSLLASQQQYCIDGDQSACTAAIKQEALNKQEASDNALKAIGIAILLPLVIIAAAAEANANQPDVIVVDHYHRGRW